MIKQKNIIKYRNNKSIVISCQNMIKNQSLSNREIYIYLKIILNKYKSNLFTDEMLILSDVIKFDNNILNTAKNFNLLKNLEVNTNLFLDIKTNDKKLKNISNMFVELNNCFGTQNALNVMENISYRSLKACRPD